MHRARDGGRKERTTRTLHPAARKSFYNHQLSIPLVGCVALGPGCGGETPGARVGRPEITVAYSHPADYALPDGNEVGRSNEYRRLAGWDFSGLVQGGRMVALEW